MPDHGVRSLVEGEAEGPALVLTRPLSFWGGIDAESGRIIDRTHPQAGACVTGTVLVMPAGRGSSSSSAVLAECIRRGTAPVALVLADPDPILVVGALVAQALYGRICPVVVRPIDSIRSGSTIRIKEGRLDLDA
jgi:predicted aconitase with swiveling domain